MSLATSPLPMRLTCVLWALWICCVTGPHARAAEPSTAPLPVPHVVSVRVTARGSFSPVPHAAVLFRCAQRSIEAQPDAPGVYQFSSLPCQGELRISAPGFRAAVVPLSVPPPQIVEIALRALPSHRTPFSTVVRADPPPRGQATTLRNEELTTLPGSLGDPFRAIGLLAGVATPIPLLPVFVVRGASPGMNGFFLDGMRMPQLFHLMVGGGVIHPQLVDDLTFFPGAYDASLGRYAGGVISATTRPARADTHHAQLEVRLFDVSALVELALPHDLRITASGHYGYPGPIVSAIDDRVDLNYWDYQLRVDFRGLTLQALGSYDQVTIQSSRTVFMNGQPTQVRSDNTFRQTFHRLQLAYRRRHAGWDIETGLVGGLDDMVIFQGNGVRKLSLHARGLVRHRFPLGAAFLDVRAGLDVELSRFAAENFDPDPLRERPDDLGELGTPRNGVVSGAFVSATLGPLDPTKLLVTASLRADVYHAGSKTLLGIDPRLQIRSQLTSWLTLHGGVGLYQQPPSFPVPLPGIDTFALQLGLQRALHGAIGEELTLPAQFSLSLTGFLQKYYDANDVVVDFGPQPCTSPPPESLTGYVAQVMRQVDGSSFGMELMLRRHRGLVTGWVAYTLGRAERQFSCGLGPADYDQTHVLNVVVQVRLPWNLMLGGRFFYSTGRPYTRLMFPTGDTAVRNNVRLPDNFQLDLRLDREWIFRRWALSVFLEVVNATFAQAIFGVVYPRVGNVTRYDQPEINGFGWILPSIGLRGRL